MIYGDPFEFAIHVDKVDSWNLPNNSWINGIFALYIQGKKAFDVVNVVELQTALNVFIKSDLDFLEENNNEISKEEIFRNAQDYFYLDGKKLYNGVRDLTCTFMEDNRFFLYFVKTKGCDRLIWSDDDRKTINECRFEPGTVWNVLKKIQSMGTAMKHTL